LKQILECKIFLFLDFEQVLLEDVVGRKLVHLSI